MKRKVTTAAKLTVAIALLKETGHESIARDLEDDPHHVGMAIIALDRAIWNIGSITAKELRAKKLLEEVLLAEEIE
jgi:hypothetical protein